MAGIYGDATQQVPHISLMANIQAIDEGQSRRQRYPDSIRFGPPILEEDRQLNKCLEDG
jgi:hypothetical protein